MKICPIANENATCNIAVPETEVNTKGKPRIAYCQQCSLITFRCVCGHWNRAFTRFCSQCGEKLEKPTGWEMASANPQRTATLPQEPSVNSLDVNYGFGSWAAGIPEIEPHEDLPKLIAIDGLIVIPNPGNKSLDAYTIVKHEDDRHLKPQWSIELNTPLTQGSTPIYHGLHLYNVVSGGIQKTAVFDGETKLINGIDAAKIKPIPACAPLKMDIGSSPTMVAGLNQGMLLFDLNTHNADYIEHKFFDEKNGPLSPTLCGTHVVFTSLAGQTFTLNIGEKPYRSRMSPWKNISFSAPVTLGNLVYFEALYIDGKRILVSYEPISDKLSILSKAADLGTDQDLNRRRSLFFHPTITDGERLFLSDTFGQLVYTYHSRLNNGTKYNLIAAGNRDPSFVPHCSIMVNNRIYSAHQTGLTVLSPDRNYAVSDHSLAMEWTDNPLPIAPPIRYGNKLFVLSNDRLVCLDY